MSKSNINEADHETESQIWLVVYRLPKKNHDATVLNWEQVNDLFRKQGGLHSQAFQLNNTKAYQDMGFTNIAKTISANEDEEIWLELHSYRDRKHMDDVERRVMSAKPQDFAINSLFILCCSRIRIKNRFSAEKFFPCYT